MAKSLDMNPIINLVHLRLESKENGKKVFYNRRHTS